MESAALQLFLTVITQPEENLLDDSPFDTFDLLVKHLLDEMPLRLWQSIRKLPKEVREICVQQLTTAQRACLLRRQGGIAQHLYEVLDALRRQMDAFAFMQRYDFMWEATDRLLLQQWENPNSTPIQLLQTVDEILQGYAICNVIRPENQEDASWLFHYWKEVLPPPQSVIPPAWPG